MLPAPTSSRRQTLPNHLASCTQTTRDNRLFHLVSRNQRPKAAVLNVYLLAVKASKNTTKQTKPNPRATTNTPKPPLHRQRKKMLHMYECSRHVILKGAAALELSLQKHSPEHTNSHAKQAASGQQTPPARPWGTRATPRSATCLRLIVVTKKTEGPRYLTGRMKAIKQPPARPDMPGKR